MHANILRTVSLALLDLRAASGAWHSYRESSDRSADRISRLYWPNSCTRRTRYLGQAAPHRQAGSKQSNSIISTDELNIRGFQESWRLKVRCSYKRSKHQTHYTH